MERPRWRREDRTLEPGLRSRDMSLDSSISDLRRRSSISAASPGNNIDTLQDRRSGRNCRTSSLALPGTNERTLLDLLVRDQSLLQPVNVSHLTSASPLPRRHSAHYCPPEHQPSMVSSQTPPPIPLRPPAVPERNKKGPPPPISGVPFASSHAIYQNLPTKPTSMANSHQVHQTHIPQLQQQKQYRQQEENQQRIHLHQHQFQQEQLQQQQQLLYQQPHLQQQKEQREQQLQLLHQQIDQHQHIQQKQFRLLPEDHLKQLQKQQQHYRLQQEDHYQQLQKHQHQMDHQKQFRHPQDDQVYQLQKHQEQQKRFQQQEEHLQLQKQQQLRQQEEHLQQLQKQQQQIEQQRQLRQQQEEHLQQLQKQQHQQKLRQQEEHLQHLQKQQQQLQQLQQHLQQQQQQQLLQQQQQQQQLHLQQQQLHQQQQKTSGYHPPINSLQNSLYSSKTLQLSPLKSLINACHPSNAIQQLTLKQKALKSKISAAATSLQISTDNQRQQQTQNKEQQEKELQQQILPSRSPQVGRKENAQRESLNKQQTVVGRHQETLGKSQLSSLNDNTALNNQIKTQINHIHSSSNINRQTELQPPLQQERPSTNQNRQQQNNILLSSSQGKPSASISPSFSLQSQTAQHQSQKPLNNSSSPTHGNNQIALTSPINSQAQGQTLLQNQQVKKDESSQPRIKTQNQQQQNQQQQQQQQKQPLQKQQQQQLMNTTPSPKSQPKVASDIQTQNQVVNGNNNNVNSGNGSSKMSVRQDSNVSSDSFSQTSSPSYNSKTMETPLLPAHHHPKGTQKGSSGAGKGTSAGSSGSGRDSISSAAGIGATAAVRGGISTGNAVAGMANGTTAPLTKSISTPASLQTIVRFHHGSNMSLHHRIIRDMRRPSAHYVTRGRLRFRFAQVLVNALALLAIAGGLAAYFRAYPSTVRYVNKTVTTTTRALTVPEDSNPAPGICLPVIVKFCKQHRVSYNFTMFPNYMGHFTQREAQQELEVYDAVVDVRCYELAALFLCSVFVPKCGPTGQLVRPCRDICYETKRRCGFFLEVFGLTLPDYLDCELFPESPDPDVCVGHQEVVEAEIRAQQPVCNAGFQCDTRRCIPADWRCDGHVDCEDQSDELNCEECAKGMIHCGEKKCMAQSHMCDGVVDCPWGQDERNCIRLSERMGDVGHGLLEIFNPEDQKWQSACVTHWDSAHSANHICSQLGYMFANSSGLVSKNSDRLLSPSVNTSRNILKLYKEKQTNLLKELRACPGGSSYPTVELSCSHFVCGKRRHSFNSRPSKRIVGGVESSPGDWPFLAALLGGPEEVFYCAGVLIADQWVLTASHCVGNQSSQSNPDGWTIQLGITRRHAHSYFGQKMKVKRVVPHPMYNLGVAHDNDVALFQLKSRVTFHEHLLPVCLPPPNHELTPGTVCTVIGWGKREDKDASEYEPAVNEVEVPVLNRELCNIWLEHRDLNVTEGMICAGYAEGGKDACQGDSGGPLLCQHRDRWFVGGIVSWGIKCAHPHLPGVYAYVPKYVPWITQQMALHSEDRDSRS